MRAQLNEVESQRYRPSQASAQREIGCRVIVIDDDITLARGLSRYLKFRGYDAQAFSDPERALAEIRKHPPEIVISDFTMPRIDGLQLARKLREELSLDQMPWLILVSGIALTANQRLDFDDYYLKPFRFDALVKELDRIWAREAPTETLVPQPSPHRLRSVV